MESASALVYCALVYCDSDMIPSYEGIMFECPSDHKVITISEDISLDTLRKIINDAIRGYRILNYVACERCQKKVTKEGNQYTCRECRQSSKYPTRFNVLYIMNYFL